MKLVGATGDWTAKTMTNAYPAIRGVYALVGSTDRVERRRLRLPAQLQPDQPQRRLRLHGPWLLGIDDPASTREGEQQAREARGPLHLRRRATPPRRTGRPPSSSKPT